MNKLIVSLSPHVHGGDSVKKNMYGVLIALIPAFLVSLYFFGLGALIVTATSVAACLFFEKRDHNHHRRLCHHYRCVAGL